MTRRIDQKQLVAGGIFLAIGGTAVFLSGRMDLGTTTRIGPGGFPLLIGAVLAVLGLVNLAAALASKAGGPFDWREGRAALLIPLSVLAFAFVIEEFGLMPAIVAAVLIGGFAAPDPRVRDIVLMALGLAVAGAGIFVYALGLPFSLFLSP